MNNREYKYCLPKSGVGNNNEPQEQITKTNSIIIIGANGSGKSRFGAWIEDVMNTSTRRISAQRSLMFNDSIQLRSYEQAQMLLETGQENTSNMNRSARWGGEFINGCFVPTYTTSLLNDYEYVLAAIVAQWHVEQNQYIEECKQLELMKAQHKPVPTMILDRLKKIWNYVFPHRDISLDDAKVTAKYGAQEYKGKYMSDGERVALYLIAQVLCAPENKILIIDEPEIHIHRSIMNRLWSALEQERIDCLFIFVTHDTEFAAAHRLSEKIWVKNFNGTTWEWEKVAESGLPDKLLLNLLGNRKPVLFVEGTENSYDTKLYQAIYKSYFVVPCGSCTEVIQRTKAYNATA
ncbi:MAG: ATP-binding protein [Christensenellaceae bacterium]|jgi:ATPase subunit of ABC transporter with duplicated ATPase domains|nr:ATP-binding protein [Christensenellaceae bacterium]